MPKSPNIEIRNPKQIRTTVNPKLKTGYETKKLVVELCGTAGSAEKGLIPATGIRPFFLMETLFHAFMALFASVNEHIVLMIDVYGQIAAP
jgi:hypothetical protein